MARRKNRGRPVNGMLLLDKPDGLSSNKALQKVKWLFKAAKAGHTGSLDPIATGMLPICFGEATKYSQYLLNSDKRYEVIGRLGEKTETADREGAVIETCEVNITEAELVTVCEQFVGEIEQVPSMYSALKHNGQPLYKLARQGIEVERKARKITLFSIELVSFESPHFTLRVHCSKGTYIRNLVEDIGDTLKCCAHVRELRRLQSGELPSDQMVTIEQLEAIVEQHTSSDADDAKTIAPAAYQSLDELLLPMTLCVADLPAVTLDDDMAFYVKQGQAVQCPGAPVEGQVALFEEQTFMGVGEINDDGQVAPRRLIRTDEQ